MRKGRDGGKKNGGEKKGEKMGKKGEKTDDYIGHYVIASSWPPERQPLERRPLVPILSRVYMKLEARSHTESPERPEDVS